VKDLNEGWVLKIIDFDATLIKMKFGSNEDGWLSPQKQARQRFYPEKSDVYSLGIVFYQFLTYKNVKNTTHQEMYQDIENLEFNDNTKDFLKVLLSYDESQRLTFAKSLEYLDLVKGTLKLTSSI
jgi:serine/threonine protein kinase